MVLTQDFEIIKYIITIYANLTANSEIAHHLVNIEIIKLLYEKIELYPELFGKICFILANLNLSGEIVIFI